MAAAPAATALWKSQVSECQSWIDTSCVWLCAGLGWGVAILGAETWWHHIFGADAPDESTSFSTPRIEMQCQDGVNSWCCEFATEALEGSDQQVLGCRLGDLEADWHRRNVGHLLPFSKWNNYCKPVRVPILLVVWDLCSNLCVGFPT